MTFTNYKTTIIIVKIFCKVYGVGRNQRGMEKEINKGTI
jgi:hypothetical protein